MEVNKLSQKVCNNRNIGFIDNSNLDRHFHI